MIEIIQELIETLTQKRSDERINVFQVEIKSFADGLLVLAGRVLEQNDIEALTEAFAKYYKTLQVDVSAIEVLRKPNNPILSIGTNLTSLHTSTSFLAEMSSQMVYGEVVEVLAEQSRWAYTRQVDGYLGWTYKPFLVNPTEITPTHVVLTPAQEVRTEADLNAPILSRIFGGTRVKVETIQDGWAKVVTNVIGWIPLENLRAMDEMPRSEDARRAQMMIDAQRLIGIPYLWGGTSGNGIDCSGFARLLHRYVGVEIARDADMQSAQCKHVNTPFQPGDLFFFGEGDSDRRITHVGVSMGGWKVIHSSRIRNGVYVDDVQERESLRSIFAHAGTFVGK